MDKEICTINLAKSVLDNDYTFFESGKILHFFDQSIYKPNIEHWTNGAGIDINTKNKLMAACTEEHNEAIGRILFP